MVPYYGDFPLDHAAIRICFNTFTSDDPSASVTITNLADTDVHVHKDGGTTQTTAGATVVLNFDGVTGNHFVLIDSSADAFYVAGSEYQVRIEGTTVDAGTINAFVGCFSIERSGGVLALMKATTLASIKAETALIVEDTGTTIPATITTAQNDLDTITGTAGVLIGTDAANVTEISDAVWDEDATGHQNAGTFGLAIGDPAASTETIWKSLHTDAAGAAISDDIKAIKAETVLILADTAAMQPEVAKLVFTKANELDVNTKSINDAEVIGDGNATPWDGV